jgi:hypothetical protein
VDGFDPDEVYARAVADEPVSTPIWREVAARFAQVVLHAGEPYAAAGATP